MNNSIDLSQVLTQTMKSLGFSDKLTTKALGDLEKVVAVRVYNKIISLLPPSTTKEFKTNDYQSIIEVARQNIDQNTLQDCVLDIVKNTLDEYFDLMTDK